MLDKLKKRIMGDKTGFSVAEMLIVLLILSFLILALPPLVHKKVEKRVTRGDHGRYECWRDPETGDLMEFYATEKSGADAAYVDAAGNPIGKVVTECKFNPEEMAPNAAYFSFQAVGGGSGGTYPPYDPNDTTYKNDDYKEMAEVKYNTQCCKNMANTAKITKEGACDNGDKSNTQTCTGDWGTYCKLSNENDPKLESASCPNYAVSLNKLATEPDKSAWLKAYWEPVQALTNLKICSSRGFTGTPSTKRTSAAEGAIPTYTYFYGGQGGDGACMELPKEYILIDTATRIQIVQSARPVVEKAFGYLENGKIPTRYSWEYDLDPKDHTPNPVPIKQVGYDPATGEVYDVVCGMSESPYTAWIDTCDAENANYEANYISAAIEDNGTVQTSCFVRPGGNGKPADQVTPNQVVQYDLSFKGNPSMPTSTECPLPWQRITDQAQLPAGALDTTTGLYSSTPVVELPTFPASVKYERFYGYDTPTFGFAGAPGEAISMFLPKLDKNLTFEIGNGGAQGQAGDKKGGNGSDTIVYSDGVEILRAAGGLGLSTGEAGSKVFLFGEDVFKGRSAEEGTIAVSAICELAINKDDPTTWPIAGCLDKRVARDNEKRFAVNSDFYAVLELDAESTTPSAINYLYGGLGQNLLPGSGGDGGYSFLRSTTGEERLVITGNPASTGWTRTYEYNNNQPYRCFKANDQFKPSEPENDYGATGELVPAPGTVCQPTRGYPGAVVIVW